MMSSFMNQPGSHIFIKVRRRIRSLYDSSSSVSIQPLSRRRRRIECRCRSIPATMPGTPAMDSRKMNRVNHCASVKGFSALTAVVGLALSVCCSFDRPLARSMPHLDAHRLANPRGLCSQRSGNGGHIQAEPQKLPGELVAQQVGFAVAWLVFELFLFGVAVRVPGRRRLADVLRLLGRDV